MNVHVLTNHFIKTSLRDIWVPVSFVVIHSLRGMDRLYLEQVLHRALEVVEKLNTELNDTKDKLKDKTDKTAELPKQETLMKTQLKAVKEQRDTFKQDLESTHLAKDELMKAWAMRDNAVAWKNACEIVLARMRTDIKQVNFQLMEVIQQVELSQQLEHLQMDMQQLLDEQMRMKLEMDSFSQHHHNPSGSDSSSGRKSHPERTIYPLSLTNIFTKTLNFLHIYQTLACLILL